SAALGVEDPRYYDTLVKEGPLAHPIFSVCYEWPAVLALRAKAVRESWALLGVHSTHHVIIHRLPSAASGIRFTPTLPSPARPGWRRRSSTAPRPSRWRCRR